MLLITSSEHHYIAYTKSQRANADELQTAVAVFLALGLTAKLPLNREGETTKVHSIRTTAIMETTFMSIHGKPSRGALTLGTS